MADVADAINDAVDKAKESRLNTFIALAVAITATFMALCNVKDGNVCQAMQQLQNKSVDAWAYYQAKSTKQNLAESIADELRIMRDTAPSLTQEQRLVYDKKIGDYDGKAKTYEGEKADIKKQAEDYEKEVDVLNVHDDQFDMAEACLSMAIALFGVTALTQKRWLFIMGAILAGFGLFMGIAGFAGLNVHPDFLAKLLT